MRRLAAVLGCTLGLVACGGPVEETLVDELRVLAAVPTAPEVPPGTSVDLAVTTSDPDATGFEALAWVCTPTGPPGSPCLEAQGGTTDGWVAPVEGGVATGLVPSAASAAFLTEEAPTLPATVWVLTCERGVCPLVRDAVGRTSEDPGWDELVADLSDPADAARDLPLVGTSLIRRTLVVSVRAEEERNQHPRIVASPEEALGAAPAEEARFEIGVEDEEEEELLVYGFATLGGLDAVAVEPESGVAELGWFPGEEAESGTEATLYVVVSDGLGGEAVWTGTGRVSAP